MKNVLLILSLLAFEASAQRYYRNNPVSDSTIKANRIYELQIAETHISNKGKISTLKWIYHYDRQGGTTFYGVVDDTLKSKRLILSESTSLPQGGQFGRGQASAHSWGQSNYLYLYEYNDKEQITSSHTFNDKGKGRSSSQYTYNDSHLLVKLQYFNSRHKLTQYYAYEYASNKKMKHSALYKGNGKLIRYWDYNCDDAGAMSHKVKDTLKICTSKEYLPDGTIITTTNSFNFNGTPVKYVEYRNAQERVIKSLRYHGKNEILTYKMLSDYAGTRLVKKYTWYASDKGKPSYSSAINYDIDGRMTAQTDTSFNNKKTNVWTYKFNYGTNGLLKDKKGFYNGRLSMDAHFRYWYYRRD